MVHRVTERGDIRVQYEGCTNRWTFHPAALIKVDATLNGVNDGASTSANTHHQPLGRQLFNVGDKVRVICDAQAVRTLQRGHGEWVEDLLQVRTLIVILEQAYCFVYVFRL